MQTAHQPRLGCRQKQVAVEVRLLRTFDLGSPCPSLIAVAHLGSNMPDKSAALAQNAHAVTPAGPASFSFGSLPPDALPSPHQTPQGQAGNSHAPSPSPPTAVPQPGAPPAGLSSASSISGSVSSSTNGQVGLQQRAVQGYALKGTVMLSTSCANTRGSFGLEGRATRVWDLCSVAAA